MRPSEIGRWPDNTSTSCDCPFPETPAMPTISPAWTFRLTFSSAGNPSSWSATSADCAIANRSIADHHARHGIGGQLDDLAAADSLAATQHRDAVRESEYFAE